MSEDQRRQQLLEISRHAVRLFAAQGVAATSGEQIARAAGVSERTLWRHFSTKESCVEPLLTKMVDGFQSVLRAWPPDVELTEHLRAAYLPRLESSSGAEIQAALAVVRMTHTEPALRATYLMLRERSETTLAEVLATRAGVPPTTFEIRVRAAAINAALKVATDHLLQATPENATPETLDQHRQLIANAISLVT
ncbi:TetR/AcrR family transcriptional regulator [Kribbella sp. CA-294648]|uniref:TetR/AcrR family transcriptional regulator n=1 Tax=Kribbella sp. CA-294648 TaxID=3239948 RepID=UPI003D93FBF7